MTNRQRVFIEEYLRCWNATQAAISAGYSSHTARQIGQKLLTNIDISKAIRERIDEKAMSADEVLIRLGEHARGDMGDFLNIGSMAFSIDLNKAEEKGLTHLIKKVKTRTTTTLSKDGVETETHDMEIELYSAQDALVDIGNYHGMFKRNLDITSGNKPIDSTIIIKAVDYRTIAATLAPGSISDSDTSGEDENISDGSALG